MDSVDLVRCGKNGRESLRAPMLGERYAAFFAALRADADGGGNKNLREKVKILLDVITETDKNKAVARRTIFSLPIKACPRIIFSSPGGFRKNFSG